MSLNPVLASVTDRLMTRSGPTRRRYLDGVRAAEEARAGRAQRGALSCTNLAHACAAMPDATKARLTGPTGPNLGIVTAYNDMLSAHQPLEQYPELLKAAAERLGATAQVAGGVPAMCDGVTQGYEGMELSLFSRDVIAMGTAIALSHQMFDAALYLGVCDKIVPGLLIGALSFGHLPAVFVPAGPMTSGLANDEKAKVRQLYAEGKVGRDALLASEMASYHGPGTCTFYGTANSNQMLMELLGLHLPGTAFVNPGTPLRQALTEHAAAVAVEIAAGADRYTPIARVIDERAILNAVVGLMATGGSTNHTLHLVAIARAAGIALTWDDFHDLSAVVPLLMRAYPNGKADVNHVQAAGGIGFVMRELIDGGLLHEDVTTILGTGLRAHAKEACLSNSGLDWRDVPAVSADASVLRPLAEPFSADGGLRLLTGPLGRAVIKVSAVKPEHRIVEAPALVFDDQNDLLAAFRRGELERDFIAVVRFQGPRINGMPELHKLTPPLAVLQDRGFRVALVTDGRMSGASGKVPAAIHLSPEASVGGPLAKVRDGDLLRLDAEAGILDVLVPAEVWQGRDVAVPDFSRSASGIGRDLFGGMRQLATSAETGAMTFAHPLWADADAVAV